MKSVKQTKFDKTCHYQDTQAVNPHNQILSGIIYSLQIEELSIAVSVHHLFVT
jgi:hypothetical protein